MKTKIYNIIHLPDGYMYAIDKELKINDHEICIELTCNDLVKMEKGYGHKDFAKIIATNNSNLGLSLLPEIKQSSTNSKLGSEHNINTLYSRIAHIGEYMEIHSNCDGYEKEWGKVLKDSVKEMVEANNAKYTEEDIKGLIQSLLKAHTIGTTVFMERKAKEYLQSLKPKPIKVEVEIEQLCHQTGLPCGYPCNGEENCKESTYIKTVNNIVQVKRWINE